MRRRFRSGTSPWEHLRAGIGDTGVVGGNCTQPVPYILPSAPEPHPEDRTDRCRRLPGRGITNPADPSRLNALDAAVCLRPPQQAQEGLGPRPWRAITSPPWYAVPVSQSLTTRRTRYRGFCLTAMNSAIFAAAHESRKVPWNTARRRCATIYADRLRRRFWQMASQSRGAY